MTKRAAAAALLSLLAGCASPQAVGHGSGPSTDELDALHRSMPRPEPAPIAELTATTVTATFDVPYAYMMEWFTELPLREALPGTDKIPGVQATEALTAGPWGEPGARRRVLLNDGSMALEEIVEAELPERVRYVVWNYTSRAARQLDYGVGEFRFQDEGARTHVEWTYAFAPRGWPATWFLRGFVNGAYHEMMEVSITAMKAQAERSYAGSS